MVAVIVLIVWLLPVASQATTYWVTNAGGAANCAAASGDTDPGQYRTKGQGIACLAAGDTLIVKSGEVITTTNGDVFNEFGSVPAGLSDAQPTRILCEGDRTCTIRPSTVPNSGNIIGLRPRSYIHIGARGQGFIVDAINATHTATNPSHGIRVNNTSMTANTTGIKIIGNQVINYNAFGISSNGLSPLTHTNMEWAYNNVGPRRPPLYETSDSHPIYVVGDTVHVHHNVAHANGGAIAGRNSYGLHCWHICRNTTWEYNTVYVEGPNARGVVVGGTQGAEFNHQIRHNTFRRIGATAIDRCLLAGSGSRSVQIYNNTCDGFTVLFSNHANSTLNTFRNNVCTNRAPCSTVIDGGSPTVSNNVMGESTANFQDADNSDYSLLSTATDLINTGIDVGLPFNGPAPDIGAYETFSPSAASINTNQLDVTISMNALSPLQLYSGTTGWSVNCTGTGCGTPTVSAANIVSGSSTIVRLTISGITGTDCAGSQTWTWSYSSSTGNVQDQAMIGGSIGQRMFTYASQPVTNNCGGISTSYPPGYRLWLKLDDGASGATPTTANDESANLLHGTLTGGATWNAAGKAGNSVTLTPDSGQYVAIPDGNGFDPTSTSLTIAFWVKVTSGRESLNKGYFGAALGTNQRMFISTRDSTWKLGIQTSTDSAANGTSDLSVEPGIWTHLCLVFNSATDIATLHKNGVAGTAAGVVKSYTSYTFASNFELGRIGGIATGGGADFDDLIIYQSVQDCNALYRVREPLPSSGTGTFTQVAHQFGLVHQSPAGAWQTYGLLNTAGVSVVRSGGCSLVTQIDCTAADCAAIGVRYYYSRDGGAWQLVPDTMTSDEVEFWGTANTQNVFTGPADRLSGALAELKGQTHLDSSATTIALDQNSSYTWRGVFKFGATASGTYCFKSYVQDGTALNGGYSPSSGACLTIVNPMGSGIGF